MAEDKGLAHDAGPSASSEGQAQTLLLQTVLDSLPYPFYVVDASNYRILLANRAARQMHDAGVWTCHGLTHRREQPCDREGQRCPLELIRQTGAPVTVEHVHQDAQGHCHTVEVHAFPILDNQGRVAQIIEYCVDITEYRRIIEDYRWEMAVDEALVELADALIDPSFLLEEVAETVLEQARRLTASEHGYVSSIDPDTGGNVGHTLTGMMGRECRVKNRKGVTTPPGPDGLYPGLFGHALNTAMGFYTNAPGEHPASMGLPAGHIPVRNFLTVPAVVWGQVVGQIALANSTRDYSARDLHAIERMAKLYALAIQRMRRQTALKASEERYSLAQKAANIGCWDWNLATGKLLWSEQIEPMFGLARGAFPGTYEAFLESVHPEDREGVVNSISACVDRHENYRIEHRIIWPDGTVRWVAETGDVVRDPNGKAIRMVGVVRDITERVRAQIEIRKLNEDLERRVLERTAELTEANEHLRLEMQRRKYLEKEILGIIEREQTRIGRELHDSLGQQLTGIAIMSKVLQQRLVSRLPEEAARAGELARLTSRAIEETRQLSRGLHPVTLDENGLMAALQSLAASTETVSGVACTFQCDRPVLVRDASVAVHLYRIAQEAVSNAIRHGKARHIAISLAADHRRATLSIINDGRRFPKRPAKKKGMGLQAMGYRAEVIGGILSITQGLAGGTRVTCEFDVGPKRRRGAKKNVATDATQH
ncbi:MAG TPA: PAS domain-containing protein [Sedimentisphaerales bacterium]|jgi:PAS domain S-box-containing protein|nr:PAS domain-containing protein [Sedimentisphaerales bacterium]HNU28484.1 PAS domain-containing protein [Sedimentisphaerales bacterium]